MDTTTSQGFNNIQNSKKRTWIGVLVVLALIGGLVGGALYATNSFKTSQTSQDIETAVKNMHLALAQQDFDKVYDEYVTNAFREDTNHGTWAEQAPFFFVTSIEGVFSDILIKDNVARITYDIPGATTNLLMRIEPELVKVDGEWLINSFVYSQGYYEEADSGVSFVPVEQ